MASAAEVLAQISTPIEDPKLRPLEARRLTVLANAYLNLSRLDEAGVALEHAETMAEDAGKPEIDLLWGDLLDQRSKPDPAEKRYSQALRRSRELHNRYFEAQALNDLGYLRLRAARYDDAQTFFEGAVTAFDSIGADLYGNVTRHNLAICYAKLGDFDRALAERRKALEFMRRAKSELYQEQNLGELGNIYVAQNRAKEAIPYFEEALSLARRVHDSRNSEIWAGNLAGALLSTHNWDRAAKLNAEARALAVDAKITDAIPYLQFNEAAIAAGRGETSHARLLFKNLIATKPSNSALLWETHASAGELEASSGHTIAARAHFENAIAVIGKARSALYLVDDKITFHARLIHFYQEYVDLLMQAGDSRRALQTADSSRALVLAEGFASGVPVSSGNVDYQRVAARAGSVLLFYWLAPKQSRMWVITAQATQSFVLPPEEEIAGHVRGYQTFIEEDLGDPLVTRSADAQWLAEKVLLPAASLIPAGSRVVIVPDGALHSVNLGSLPIGDPAAYWISRVTPSIAPSLRIFAAAASRQVPRTPSLLLIGDPSHPPPGFPHLLYAAKELASVAAQFPHRTNFVLTGDRASPDGYRAADPARFSVIHFTAHALANHTSPLDSAVILAPAHNEYKLYARDIVKIPLTADLVTLSACRSAGARSYAGEGLVGFSWAFLQAGARKVVAGLWDVNDQSTAELMNAMYGGIAAGKSPEVALRDAQTAMMRSAGNLRKPYYWGPFQVYTGGS